MRFMVEVAGLGSRSELARSSIVGVCLTGNKKHAFIPRTDVPSYPACTLTTWYLAMFLATLVPVRSLRDKSP